MTADWIAIRLFQPATTGWYPKKAPQESRPVPVLAAPWPGVPARSRYASGCADACWLPIARGLTPHGLRHCHKTVMEELGIPPKLMDERMGHEDGSVPARCSHITARMRSRHASSVPGACARSLAESAPEVTLGEGISLIHSPFTPQRPRGTSQGRFPVKENRP